MFTQSRSIRKRPVRARAEMATLRLFVNDGRCVSGIYEENVIGGYQNRAGEIVLIVKSTEKDRYQLHRLEPKLGICRDLGSMSSEIQNDFDATAPGKTFYLRNIALQKMEKGDVVTSIFRLPVWYLDAKDEKAAEPKIVPLNARMHHKSRYQVLVADRALSEPVDDRRNDDELETVSQISKEK